MKKYKIIPYDDEINMYCPNCGNKNALVPIDYYDGKTGKQEAWYRCINTQCNSYDASSLRKCRCNHEWKQNWFLIFPDGKTCKKCKKCIRSTSDGAGAF